MSAELNGEDVAKLVQSEFHGGTVSATTNASERLEDSRQRLRIALLQSTNGKRVTDTMSRGSSALWVEQLKSMPVIGSAVRSLDTWWAQTPLNAATATVFYSANTVAKPIASRHPFYVVMVAAVAGAVLARTRPWRWILKPALFAGLAVRLSSNLVTRVPLQSWITLLTALTQRASTPQTAQHSAMYKRSAADLE